MFNCWFFQVLLQQMSEKDELMAEARKQFLAEKGQVDAIMRKIINEDQRYQR